MISVHCKTFEAVFFIVVVCTCFFSCFSINVSSSSVNSLLARISLLAKSNFKLTVFAQNSNKKNSNKTNKSKSWQIIKLIDLRPGLDNKFLRSMFLKYLENMEIMNRLYYVHASLSSYVHCCLS